MRLSDFAVAKKNQKPANADILRSLSPVEQELVSSFTRVEIQGKCGCTVPILLTRQMVEEVQALINWRCVANMAQGNPYVFSRPYYLSMSHLAGHEQLKQAAVIPLDDFFFRPRDGQGKQKSVLYPFSPVHS